MITVIEVMREMGVEMSNDLAWSVGTRVRVMWEERHGDLPAKELRAKTAGGGSHCFAVYPEDWRDKIVSVIEAAGPEASRQLPLF